MAKRAKRRGPGAPPKGDAARTETVRVRLTADDADRWRAEANEYDMTLSDMIRSRVDVTTRIVVRPDDRDWHWTAYNESGRVLTCTGIAAGPRLEDRVRKSAEELGMRGVDDAIVEISEEP